jgi:hypothetical protein
MSTAEILAASRVKKAAPAAVAEPEVEEPAPAPKATAAAPASKAAAGDLPKTTAERIAWCRRVDAK